MQKLTLLKNRKQKGFTLTEILLVLVIAAAIVISAFIIYPKVQASARAEAESKNIATIVAGVKALYTSTSSYTGITKTILVNAKVFPDNMLSGTGSSATPINSWKGAVDVTAATINNAGDAFTITYNGVPTAECVKMVSGMAGNFDSVGVNGTNVKASGAALNVATTASSCAANTSTNVLTFTSY